MNKIRLFLKSILLAALALSTSLQAGISPLAFNGVFECFKKPEFAPNLGCAALQTGLVNSLRFCMVNPGEKDKEGNRSWIKDRAPHPVAELATLLFPSPAGNLTAMTSHPENIGRHLTVKDVAELLNFCFRVRTMFCNYETSRKEIAEKIALNKKNKSFELVKAQDLLGGFQLGKNGLSSLTRLKNAAKSANDNSNYRYFLEFEKTHLHKNGFLNKDQGCQLISALCRRIQHEERHYRYNTHLDHFYPKYIAEQLLNAFFCLKFGQDDIPTLLQNLDDSIVDKEILPEAHLIDRDNFQNVIEKQIDDITLDDLWILQHRDLVDQIIPYARGSNPVNNGLTYAYNRTQDQLIEDLDFPDCTETVIRHLCNLLLYSKENREFCLSLVRERLKDSPYLNNLEDFYALQTPDRANSGEQSVRNSWSRVIGGLGHPVRYKQKSLTSETQNDTEVSSGIINIIRVLNIVFKLELEAEPVYKNDQQFADDVTQWAQAGLEKMFELLAPVKQVNIDIVNVSAFKAFGNYEYDCQGTIKIKVNQDFAYTMSIGSNHAQFDSIDILVPEHQIINPKFLENVTKKFKPTLQNNTGESLFLMNAKTKQIAQNLFYNLFQNGISDSIHIIQLLERLLVMTQENKVLITHAAIILRNCLQMFLWQDTTMMQQIQQTIKNWQDFAQQHNDATLIKVIQEETKSVNYSLFKNDFNDNADDLLNFFDNASKLYWHTKDYACFSLSQEHHAIQVIDFMNSGITNFEISGNCPNLSTVILWNSKELETVNLSGNLNKLASLDLSQTGITQLTILSDFPHLKIINLRQTKELRSVKISGIVESLKKIDLDHSGIELLKIQSSQCSNLEVLTLKFTCNLKKARLLGNFSKLRKLCITHSNLAELKIVGNCPSLVTQDSKIKFISS